jgi:hypothetical protein
VVSPEIWSIGKSCLTGYRLNPAALARAQSYPRVDSVVSMRCWVDHMPDVRDSGLMGWTMSRQDRMGWSAIAVHGA